MTHSQLWDTKMDLLITGGFEDYELIDSGEGRRLERFGEFILDRPDPQIIWKKGDPLVWDKASAIFERTSEDNGKWVQNISIPEKWQVHYKNLTFWVKLTPFKHTGLFPEQETQWSLLEEKILNSKRDINVLNLFGYTGAMSLVAAKAGAKVTHVDASKPAVTWANENRELNGMQNLPIRWIVDDALDFVNREIKRENKYDVVIMDPPAYGHSPTGVVWEFNKDFPRLLEATRKVLSDNPIMVLVNAYAISSSATTLANTMSDYFSDINGTIKKGELNIKEKSKGRLLSTGIYSTWEG